METFAKPAGSVGAQTAACPSPPTVERPQRADARRNRDRVMQAARDLFASMGVDAGMEDIALRAGVGVGTIYRHFPTKQALLTAMVRRRFADMTELALEVEREDPSSTALVTTLRRQAEAVSADKGFQLGAMGWDALEWSEIEPELDRLHVVTQRLIDRAVAADLVRADFTFDDMGLLMCGLTAVMYFKPAGDWRRHLELVVNGLRP